MIDTRPSSSRDDARSTHRRDVRRLIATDYSRHQLAAAICESFVQAFHLRTGEMTGDDRAWLRDWLTTAVPHLTERTVDGLAIELEAGLAGAPRNLIDSLEARRRRAQLGIE